MVTTSEIKISVVVQRESCDAAVRAVHAGFGLHKEEPSTPDVGVTTSASAAASRPAPQYEEIIERLSGMEDIVVSDVAAEVKQARVTITGLPDDPGIAARVFAVVADGGIMVDMIIQNASVSGSASISTTVPTADAATTSALLEEALRDTGPVGISCEPRVGKLTVSGIGLRSHTDVAARVFRILAENQINVQLVNTSEIKVSILVTPDEAQRACEAVRSEFRIGS